MKMTLKGMPIEKLVPLCFLLILIPLGIAGWLIGYPASTGNVDYEGPVPPGYDLGDARQALVSQGYSADLLSPEYGGDPYIYITVSSGGEGMTVATLRIPDQGQTVEIFARREIPVAPYEVLQDLHELGDEQRAIAEEDVRGILSAAGLSDAGTFTPFDDIDSLDYFGPTTVFYVLLFIHLPLTILMALLAVFLKVERRPSYPQMYIYRR